MLLWHSLAMIIASRRYAGGRVALSDLPLDGKPRSELPAGTFDWVGLYAPDAVIDGGPGFRERVKALTGGVGADVIFEAEVMVAVVDRHGRPRRLPAELAGLLRAAPET